MSAPDHELVDVGYRDPLDERDDIPDPPPTRDEYEPELGPAPPPATPEPS